ncbi:MAG: hypothetical protein QG635_1206, partial [Bacteroidota bacterium]|nr:hypothetical protein [Bacteroidota bacterium]
DGQFTCWQQEGALEIGNCVVDMIDSRDTDKFAVAATHGNGVFQSTVNTLPTPPAGKPALIKPVNDSRAITDAAVFKWQTINDAVYYKVQFSTKSDFSEIWLEKDGVTADSVLVPGLEPGLVKYYWRVAAKNAGGLSEFSDTWVLTTIIGTPELAYPEHKADSIPLDVTLMWNPVNGADSYRIQISPNFAFTQLITDSSGINDNSFKASALDMNKRYYWRVSAKNSDAVGSFSLGWYFHTQNIISVQTYYSSEFNLSGAYPSPFSTTAKIEFYLNKRKYIRLKIFDERGRLIKTLIEGEMPEGRHESVFYAGANPSGVYYLLLEADGTMMTKPVVLLR